MIITRNSPATPEALRETMSTTQSMFRVAAIQMASGPNVTANLQEAGRLIELAASTGAPIIGFNVRPNAKAREAAERNKVEFRYYDVIYHLTDWVKGTMAGELGPEIIENVVGRAEVKEVLPTVR